MTNPPTKLQRLYDEQGQSPWLDNLKRSYLRDGTLQRLVEEGVRGLTSNPTIFAKAISGSADYDDQLTAAFSRGSVEDAYWEVVVDDIKAACDVLGSVHQASGGGDGFVSIEVSPSLAHDTERTTIDAAALWARVARPNVMIKIPGTAAGLPSIRAAIGAGTNVNVTLIFSLPRYGEVIESYLAGLEDLAAAGGDLAAVHSVASFFVSRVDTEVDRRLEAVGTEAALALRGTAAVNQAKLAYALFGERFQGPRWEALAARGAHRQRPLWASTSTKNPAYPDLLYVDTLIGSHTVNTMPDPTVDAFIDHGTVARTVDVGLDVARAQWAGLAEVGVDVEDVAAVLEQEGVASFAKSFDELLQGLNDKANALS